MEEYAQVSFGEALADLLREHQGNPWHPSLQAFAKEVGINYSTLRSAVMARTMPPEKMMEIVAQHLHIRPEYFFEYRVAKICALLEARPDLAGTLYEHAMALYGEPKELR